jgi:hypothetical protein
MLDRLPGIYFYISPDKWPIDYIPENPEEYWEWMKSRQTKWLTWYHWTLQTYLYLKADGFPCQLVDDIPNEGIVLSHRYLLSDKLQPGRQLLIVCLQGDAMRHPYAQLHVVQNPQQENSRRGLLTLWESHFIPHWSQPGLIPRNPARGDKFENVVFFGTRSNLAPELQDIAWDEKVKTLGLNWQVRRTFEQWADYSDVDVVLAVRRFDPNSKYNWKPATKLYNAWLANVPIIVGRESAFQAERKSPLDYLEVNSLNETVDALQRLRDDQFLRQAMVENGRVRAQEIQPDKIVAQWRSLIEDKAMPAYERWCATPHWLQQTFLKGRRYLDLEFGKLPSQTKQEYLNHVKNAAEMKKKGLW